MSWCLFFSPLCDGIEQDHMQNVICTFQPRWYYVCYIFLLDLNHHIKWYIVVSAFLQACDGVHTVHTYSTVCLQLSEQIEWSPLCGVFMLVCAILVTVVVTLVKNSSSVYCTCPNKHRSCKCECFAILVWTSLHPSHMVFILTFLNPSPPLSHSTPHTLCLPVGPNPFIPWKKTNVPLLCSPLSCFCLCGCIKWAFTVTVA